MPNHSAVATLKILISKLEAHAQAGEYEKLTAARGEWVQITTHMASLREREERADKRSRSDAHDEEWDEGAPDDDYGHAKRSRWGDDCDGDEEDWYEDDDDEADGTLREGRSCHGYECVHLHAPCHTASDA